MNHKFDLKLLDYATDKQREKLEAYAKTGSYEKAKSLHRIKTKPRYGAFY